MRKMLKRALALTLTVAMVTVCCLSGLILPAAAGDTAANLLEGKTEASYTMAGGDTPLGIRADVSLKANTRYAVRVTVKSTAKATISFPDISTATITVLATAEWRTYQAMFTMSSNAAEYAMKVTFAGTAATDALELTNIELMEAPADGTFNLLPASDSNTQSSFLSECFKKGLPIEADPDNPSNAVLHFTNDAVYAGSWDMSGINFTSGKILKLTFKLKGGALRIDCGDSRPVYLPNPDATSIGGNGKYTYYKTDEWTECSYYIKPSASNQIRYFVLGNRNSSGKATELWLDDIRLYEVTEATGIQLSSHQLVLPPDAMEQLTVRTVPGNGWLTDSEIVWSSDDEDVVKVDQSGMVIAVGEDGDTATVTATTGNGFTDSCTVTIDGDAQSGEPKSDNLLDGKVEPSYTMHGGDAANAHNALVVLRANTRYALRVTAQADAAASIAFPGVASETIAVSATDEWRTYQVMFTPAALILNFKMQVTFATADAAHTLQYQNIELLEAPADGTFNLLPASDSNTQSSFLSECFKKGLPIEADPDNPSNAVLHFTSDAVYAGSWDMSGIDFTSGKILKLTFKLKGGALRIDCGDSRPVYLPNPDATSIGGNGKYTYYKTDEGTECSYYIKPSAANQIQYFVFGNRSSGAATELWLDDIRLYEVTPATGLTLNKTALSLAPANFAQLTVRPTPQNSMLCNTDYQWTTDNAAVVGVDNNGRVTAYGSHGQSATITVTNGDGFTASCVVTIDDTAESAPQVDSIALTPAGGSLDPYQSLQLQVVGTPAENIIGHVTFTSSDETLATVDQNGLVTAKAKDGTVTITATTQFGKVARADIQVYAHQNLLINGDFEQDASVSWRNTEHIKDGIGTYGSRGYHLIQKDTTAVGTYYSQDIVLKPATKYIIRYDYKVEQGGGFRLYAAELGAGNVRPTVFCEAGTLDTAEWQHAEAVFTTSDFYDAEAGWAMLFTTSASDNAGDGSASAYVDNLTIREYVEGEPVQTVTLDQQTVQIAPSRSVKLNITATPAKADLNGVEWTTSDPTVAYVVSGHVIGVGAGTATVTATTKNGKTATCQVEVSGMKSPLVNGDFETNDGWVLSGNAAYGVGKGVLRSDGMRLMPAQGANAAGSFSQTVTGLQPDSAYQLHLQMRRTSGTDSYFTVKLLAKDGTVLSENRGGGKTGTVKYTSSFYKYDIVTPPTISATDELTLVIEHAEGGTHFTFDHLILTESTSEVDLIVLDMFWGENNEDQVTPGTPLNFRAAFLNQGAEDYVGGKPVTFDVLVDAQKVGSFTYTGRIMRNELLIASCEDAWIATPGDHMITVRVNSTMSVLESDDTNNYLTYNLRVAGESAFVQPPAAALAYGFNDLVFSDHFETNATIDKAATGQHGYKWYVTRPWGEANLGAEDYRVENGVLHLTTDDTLWNYSLATIDAKCTGVGFAFNKGYIEIRVRMKSTGDGGTVNGIRVPAVWAHPASTIWGTRGAGQTSIELDWFEYWGNKYGTLRFDTTLHETRYDAQGKEIGKVTHGEKHTEPIGDYEWHTYGMAWSDGVLKTYFDNEWIGTLTYSEDGYPDPMPSGSLNIQAGTGDTYNGLWSALDHQDMPIILGGASDFPLEVDWVHVWQSNGTLEPEPEGPADNATVSAFLREYLTQTDGTLAKRVTVKNYQKILQGEAVYLSLSAEDAAAIDERLGCSYIAMVAEIYDAIVQAENFIAYYACDENGVPYTAVDATNYAWIAGAATEWGAFSDFVRALIDKTLANYGLPSFTDTLAQAQAFDPHTDEPLPPEPVQGTPASPSGGLHGVIIALIALGGLLVIGGAVTLAWWLCRKKKKTV